MKKITKLAAAVVLSAFVLGSFTTSVSAITVDQNQELNQSVKVNCTTTGSYGQSTSCSAEGTQNGKQSQTVTVDGVQYFVRTDGSYVQYHRPVNTSVDGMTLAGLIGTAVTSAGAGFLVIKKRQ